MTMKGNADFLLSKDPELTRGRARFKHGGIVGAVKWHPFSAI